MPRRSLFAVVLVLLVGVLLTASCAKLSAPTTTPGGIPAEVLEAKDLVPQAWGNLVTVSSVAEYPDLVQLWFQDQDGTVRYVVMSLRTHELRNAHVLRRK
jgi:hypothetical protein